MDDATNAVAPPGELMRLVAGRLAEAKVDALPTDHPDDCCLIMNWQHAQCLLTVTDWGQVEWEYRPWNTTVPDPRWLASLTAGLLAGQVATASRPATEHHEGLSGRALAGLELKGRGFDVALDVVRDTERFEVYAEIIVTVPGKAEAAEVRITDEGSLTWIRSYWTDSEGNAITWNDQRSWAVTDPEALAADITATLVHAMHGAGRHP